MFVCQSVHFQNNCRANCDLHYCLFLGDTIARRGLNVKVISQGQRSVKCACYTMSLLQSLCFVPYVYPGGPVCRGQQTASQPLSLVVISNVPDKMCKVIWHKAAPACPFSWGCLDPITFLGSTQVCPLNDMSIGSSVFARLGNVLSTQTDTQTPATERATRVTIARIYAVRAMRPKTVRQERIGK